MDIFKHAGGCAHWYNHCGKPLASSRLHTLEKATTPVFLPGESPGQMSLAGYSSWGRKESDMAEHAQQPLGHSNPPWGIHARENHCSGVPRGLHSKDSLNQPNVHGQQSR